MSRNLPDGCSLHDLPGYDDAECPECGSYNDPDNDECDECGHSLRESDDGDVAGYEDMMSDYGDGPL